MPQQSFARASDWIDVNRSNAGGVATRWDEAGLLREAASNTLRLDTDPITLAPRGLALERARSNLIGNPRWNGTVIGTIGLGGGATNWSLFGSSGQLQVLATYPVGDALAFRLRFVSPGDNAGSYLVFTNSETPAATTPGAPHTLALSVRLAGGSIGPGTLQMVMQKFNAGAYSSGTASAALPVTTAWQRFELRSSLAASENGTRLDLRWGTTANTPWDVTFDLIIPQIEANPKASTPVLPPVAVNAPGMAAADAAQLRNFATAINPSQGTLVIDFVTQGPLANAPGVMRLDDGTTDNAILALIETNGQLLLQTVDAGIRTNRITLGSVTLDVPQRLALSYGPAGLAASLNNGAVASAAVTIPPNLSRLAIGRWQAPPAGLLDGWLRRLRYARSQLTGTALQAA